MLTSEQFERMRRLALRLAGIELFDRHWELLGRRWARESPASGIPLDGLLGAAEGGDREAGRRLLRLVTTGFTGFFRHPWHFAIAAEHALWAAHRRGVARLWSAATSTGEEAYSLAMEVLDAFRQAGPPVQVVASDIDEASLETARRGRYGERALGPVDPARRGRFFGMPDAAGWREVNPEVRGLVAFHALNLVEAAWPVAGPFDGILCRNVLMYLEPACRYSVLERMASVLAPDGVLFLDPAEHPGPAGHLFTGGDQGVYRRRTRPAVVPVPSPPAGRTPARAAFSS